MHVVPIIYTLGKTFCNRSLHEKCPNTKFFLVRNFRQSDWIRRDSRTEYGEILRISPYSVRLLENTGQKKFRIWTLFTQWLLLKVCESFLSRHNIKPVVCFSLCQASLGFQRRENKMNTVYEKWNYFSICRYLVWCA